MDVGNFRLEKFSDSYVVQSYFSRPAVVLKYNLAQIIIL